MFSVSMLFVGLSHFFSIHFSMNTKKLYFCTARGVTNKKHPKSPISAQSGRCRKGASKSAPQVHYTQSAQLWTAETRHQVKQRRQFKVSQLVTCHYAGIEKRSRLSRLAPVEPFGCFDSLTTTVTAHETRVRLQAVVSIPDSAQQRDTRHICYREVIKKELQYSN